MARSIPWVRCPLALLFISCGVLLPAGTAAEPSRRAAPVERVSLPQGTLGDAWALPGFRLGLGLEVGALWGQGNEAQVVGPVVRAGWRFGKGLSLLASFTYTVLMGDLVGLRYAVALEPVWHPIGGLSLSMGVGYAGILGENNRQDYLGGGPRVPPANSGPPSPFPETEGGGDSKYSLSQCSGGGLTGFFRAAYLFRIGRVGSTGPVASLIAQTTRCVSDEGEYDPVHEEFKDVVEWWSHFGFSVTWTFLWR